MIIENLSCVATVIGSCFHLNYHPSEMADSVFFTISTLFRYNYSWQTISLLREKADMDLPLQSLHRRLCAAKDIHLLSFSQIIH